MQVPTILKVLHLFLLHKILLCKGLMQTEHYIHLLHLYYEQFLLRYLLTYCFLYYLSFGTEQQLLSHRYVFPSDQNFPYYKWLYNFPACLSLLHILFLSNHIKIFLLKFEEHSSMPQMRVVQVFLCFPQVRCRVRLKQMPILLLQDNLFLLLLLMLL